MRPSPLVTALLIAGGLIYVISRPRAPWHPLSQRPPLALTWQSPGNFLSFSHPTGAPGASGLTPAALRLWWKLEKKRTRDLKPEAAHRKLRRDISSVYLAAEGGLFQDPYFAKYYRLERRALEYRLAALVSKKVPREYWNWQPAPGLASRLVERPVPDQKNHKNSIEEWVAGTLSAPIGARGEFEKDRSVYLRELFSVALPEEINDFLAGRNQARLDSSLNNLTRNFLVSLSARQARQNLFLPENEFHFLTLTRLAPLYLDARYDQAGKGIYPAAPMKTPLPVNQYLDRLKQISQDKQPLRSVRFAWTSIPAAGKKLPPASFSPAEFTRLVNQWRSDWPPLVKPAQKPAEDARVVPKLEKTFQHEGRKIFITRRGAGTLSPAEEESLPIPDRVALALARHREIVTVEQDWGNTLYYVRLLDFQIRAQGTDPGRFSGQARLSLRRELLRERLEADFRRIERKLRIRTTRHYIWPPPDPMY